MVAVVVEVEVGSTVPAPAPAAVVVVVVVVMIVVAVDEWDMKGRVGRREKERVVARDSRGQTGRGPAIRTSDVQSEKGEESSRNEMTNWGSR